MHSFEDDKELDQITRSAAEAYEAPSAGNWDMMQRVLDRELPQQKKRRFGIIWWIFPGLFALGIGSYFIYNNQKQSIQNSTAKETIPTNTQTSNQLLAPAQPNIATENKIAQSVPQLEIVQPIKKQELIKKDVGLSIAVSNPVPTKSSNAFVTQLDDIKKANAIETDYKTNNVVANTVNPSNNNQQTIIDTATKQNTSLNPVVTETVAQKNKTIHLNQVSKKGFFIGLVGGVDVSTVKYSYASNPGYNIGGTIGYRFNNHLSLQTGAVYTQKNYKLKGQDFTPPKGSWASYYNIETVDGYCKMWDIPLIATYHFNSNTKTNTFISVGTSSYFMKAENYNYLYNYNNQYYTRSASINSTDQHLFALLHISAGVEKSIGKNISTIIEPYAKLPLGGVGYGSIHLSSFGLNFSVQYKQPKK